MNLLGWLKKEPREVAPVEVIAPIVPTEDRAHPSEDPSSWLSAGTALQRCAGRAARWNATMPPQRLLRQRTSTKPTRRSTSENSSAV